MEQKKISRTKAECHNEALKYNSRNEFKKNSSSVYYYSLNKCWLDEICSHMIIKQKSKTKIECHNEALKYKRRIDFSDNNSTVYYYSLNKGWLDEICSHMEYYNPIPNTLYLWKTKEYDIWKIGICENNRLEKRINEVAKQNNFNVDLNSIKFKLESNCRNTEIKFLKLGIKPKLKKADGYSEFRILSKEELKFLQEYFDE